MRISEILIILMIAVLMFINWIWWSWPLLKQRKNNKANWDLKKLKNLRENKIIEIREINCALEELEADFNEMKDEIDRELENAIGENNKKLGRFYLELERLNEKIKWLELQQESTVK